MRLEHRVQLVHPVVDLGLPHRTSAGEDPLSADLGEEGQGDLAPEDE